MKKSSFFFIWMACQTLFFYGQSDQTDNTKLVVGIVVDQMRFDQLYKYQNRFSENGFNRLINEGFNYKNAHYNYVPTVTAAGHASIYTGVTPATHGIISNSWYERVSNKTVSNVEDDAQFLIGSKDSSDVGRSPQRLLTTTISDQIRLASNFRSKVISVSLKDRGAILPGGHTANAAYWHDWQSSPGYFVSSSYYMEQIPKWVSEFNKKGKSDQYLDFIWNPLYGIDTYTQSDSDDNNYERVLRTKDRPVFPYNFKELRKTYKELKAEYQLLWLSPTGNTLLTEFAIEAIANEKPGKDNHPDLLNISYSVPDVVGHTFGPQSIEIEDTYLRLDKDIGMLLDHLDKNVGIGKYTVFLTSDHGAIPVASYLKDHKLPSGIARIDQYEDALRQYLKHEIGVDSLLLKFDYEQVYLNHSKITQNGLEVTAIQDKVADFLGRMEGIDQVLTAHDLQIQEYNYGIRHKIQQGYQRERSGDIIMSFKNGFIQIDNPDYKIEDVKGTTHGSGWSYDSHVPLLWYGSNIPKGEAVRKVSITDIAPTISMLLNVQLPSGSTADICHELFTTTQLYD